LKSKRVFQSRNGYSNETVQPFITNPLGRFRVQSKTNSQPVVFNTPADFYKLILPKEQATTSPLPTPPPLDHGEFDAGTPPESQNGCEQPQEPQVLDMPIQVPETRISSRPWQPSGQALRNLAMVIDVLEEEQWEQACTGSTTDSNCPDTFQQAMAGPDAPKWIVAMRVHMETHRHKGTMEVTESLPSGKKALDCRWVFAIKYNKDNSVSQYKARLVAKGFQQKHGIDFKETFATVAHLKSLRVLLAICAAKGLKPSQLDVGSAFLNADLEEEVYMRFPPGYPGKPGQVIRLRKALFGLKQASRRWAKQFLGVLQTLDFKPTLSDPCVFVHSSQESYLLIHVDDCITATADEELRAKILTVLRKAFETIKDTDQADQFVGLDIDVQPDGSIHVCQQAYLERLITRFNMEDSSPVPTPARVPLSSAMCPKTHAEREAMKRVPYLALVGGLLWTCRMVRLDVAHVR
jgi:hypothetical protein